MAEVTVLFPGYYLAGKPSRACSTVSLVRDGDLAIVVDPGTVPDPAALLANLSAAGITADRVGVVFVTHAHTDHYRQAGMFPAARLLDAWGWWEGDLWRDFDGHLSPACEVVATPGHSGDSLTLFVQTSTGEVALCGDVIYDEASGGADDPFVEDTTALAASRRLVLTRADWIVPGHGTMFRNARRLAPGGVGAD